MKFLWRNDLGQGKHDPLEVTHVVTKSGSQISADLVVPMEPVTSTMNAPPDDSAGLLEVIEAQMAAIDELTKAAEGVSGADYAAQAKAHTDLQEWADQFPHLVENLCMALGFARNPVGPTGIPELDIIVSLAR